MKFMITLQSLYVFRFTIMHWKREEWKKTKRAIRANYLHLSNDSHGLMWSRYITTDALAAPNICMLLEVLLIFLFFSTSVERGISTLDRNLTSQRTSMSNKMLDNIFFFNILVIKVNVPELAKVIDKIENVIVERALPKYFSLQK